MKTTAEYKRQNREKRDLKEWSLDSEEHAYIITGLKNLLEMLTKEESELTPRVKKLIDKMER